MSDRVIANLLYRVKDNDLGILARVGQPVPIEDGLFRVPVDIQIPMQALTLLPQGEAQYVGGFDVYVVVGNKDNDMSDVARKSHQVRVPAADVAKLDRQVLHVHAGAADGARPEQDLPRRGRPDLQHQRLRAGTDHRAGHTVDESAVGRSAVGREADRPRSSGRLLPTADSPTADRCVSSSRSSTSARVTAAGSCRPTRSRVQQVVEEALAKMFQQSRSASMAPDGPTPACMPTAQRAHVDVPFEIPPRGLVLGLNQIFCRTTSASRRPSRSRTTSTRASPRKRRPTSTASGTPRWRTCSRRKRTRTSRSRSTSPLMHDAAQALVGTHDFTAFTVADPEVSLDRPHHPRRSTSCATATPSRITVTADGFLRSMVRRIAGSLIEIGRGKLAPAHCSPRRAGPRPPKASDTRDRHATVRSAMSAVGED